MYADTIAAARRECPADDIATKLLQAEVSGDALTQEQFNVFFLLLSVAGNETTRNSITHGMQAFFDHPDQWEIFKKERPLDTAVEEIVRWATPVIQFQRTALSDYELGGQTIAKGDRVAIYYSAANRDDTALDAPDTFDIKRDEQRARRVRRRWPALLPRRQPGPRDRADHVQRDRRPDAGHPPARPAAAAAVDVHQRHQGDPRRVRLTSLSELREVPSWLRWVFGTSPLPTRTGSR